MGIILALIVGICAPLIITLAIAIIFRILHINLSKKLSIDLFVFCVIFFSLIFVLIMFSTSFVISEKTTIEKYNLVATNGYFLEISNDNDGLIYHYKTEQDSGSINAAKLIKKDGHPYMEVKVVQAKILGIGTKDMITKYVTFVVANSDQIKFHLVSGISKHE
ncbi:MAG: hypothetical protein WDK95_10460 [Syntrophorhabdaceae bacterium]|jgi:predicted PurR-regulated permease PerM